MIDTDDLRLKFGNEEKNSKLFELVTVEDFKEYDFDEYFSDDYVLWLENKLLDFMNEREIKFKKLLDDE